jgi:hypothetical protein
VRGQAQWLQTTQGRGSKEMTDELVGIVDVLQRRMFEQRARSAEKPSVREGSFVKVRLNGVQFWCRIWSVRGDGALVGTVSSDVCGLQWHRGDEIVLQQSHVLDVSEMHEGGPVGYLVAACAIL